MDERDLLQAGFRYALSLRAGYQDAEDLVQEAWYRLYRHDGRVGSKSLLFTAIRNIHIDRYRRDRLVVFEPLDEADEPADDGAQVLDSRLAARDLEAPLAMLRPEEREALFLMVVEGYTAQQVADFTGRSRGTVLTLTHRAKQKLRGALTANQSGDIAAGSGGSKR
jgi:RNA polymerase sigma-70 factor (ECF subfamily)